MSPKQPFLGRSRNATRGALHEDPKNGCVGDYTSVNFL